MEIKEKNSEYMMNSMYVMARYTKQEEPTFTGNKLIEALPPERNIEQVFRDICEMPIYDEKEKDESERYRINAVCRLENIIIPIAHHIKTEQMISIALRHGYVDKHIESSEYTRDLLNLADKKKGKSLLKLIDNRASAPSGFSIIGISGGGKTTAITKILKYYPRVIEHRGENDSSFYFLQVPYLKIECTYNGAIKGLCQKIFQEFDEVLGTKYLEMHGKQNRGVDYMVASVKHLVYKHGVGIIILDEIQNLSKCVKRNEFMDFLLSLTNECKVPIVYIGTYKAYKGAITGDFRHRRRINGSGIIKWDSLKGEEYDIFLETLWKYQWTKKTTELTDEIKKVMYQKTGGIVDRIIKIFMSVQIYAITSEQEKIRIQDIVKIAKEKFSITIEAIEAIERGDVKALAKYDDLYAGDWKEIVNEALQVVDENELKRARAITKEKIQRKNDLKSEVIVMLSAMGLNEKDIIPIFEDIYINSKGKIEKKVMLKKICTELLSKEIKSDVKNERKIKKSRVEKGFAEKYIKEDFKV
ncbi:MAG: ATP-binding protein [Clostridium sp.]|uniref:ATP-binding protein n=1 Tax=Clostridium sp. TaxID=1506 RepID=UPI003F39EDF4